MGIGKAKEGADYETIFIWGAAKEGDPIGLYRSTDKCKTFERINDDKHQFGGPGNGNFVQGDMNTFGVVYMSTVGRGLVVGAPEGTDFVAGVKRAVLFAAPSLRLENRSLHVVAPAGGTVRLFAVNGKGILSERVQGVMRLDLAEIPAGAYVAKFLDSRGKVQISKKLTLR